jgi:C-terminal processing protease CtpA/Prc
VIDTHLELEGTMNMKKFITSCAVAAVVLAISVPAFAGENCGSKTSAMTTAGWSGAWLERSATGAVTVAAVAKGSPAAKAGLKSGDVVLAVNGYDLSNSDSRAMCASKASCAVGSTVSYTVNRAGAKKDLKLKLAKLPADATERFASREATFEPMYAAVVMPVSAN